MKAKATTTVLPLVGAALLLCGCGGVFESSLPSAQAFVLRLPPRAVAAPVSAAPVAGSLLVQRPEAGPGLDSDRIALLRTDRRFDFYAASRWAGAVPDLLESVIVDALREAGVFAAVFDDTAPFAPRYNLRVSVRRFEADYTGGGGPPTVYVTLDCTLGRHRDRELLASFRAQGSAPAAEDRLTSVVAAYEIATAAAVAELERAMHAAVAAEAAGAPSESR
jgi:cholesterol transport system auxiliary component